MSTRFAATDELVVDLETRSFDRPPAVVCNAHVTGLGVARALDAHDRETLRADVFGRDRRSGTHPAERRD